MDQLFKRYADPFSFVDGMIQTGRFCEFVENFVETVRIEKEERHQWDFFLHKVWEGTFQDFRDGIKISKQNQAMSEQAMETTIKSSMDILKRFNPETGGEK